MLCFLAPIPAMPENNPPAPQPARRGSGAAAVLVVLAAVCALLAPLGWTMRPRGAAAPQTPPVPHPPAVAARCAAGSRPAAPTCR